MINRKAAPEGMYTAAEAQEILNLKPTTFYNQVNAGKIKKITLPGRKEGFYSKSAIDTYARELLGAKEAYIGGGKLDFVPALSEDLPIIHELVASVSGGEKHAVPVDVLKGWIRKNPQSIHVLRRRAEIMGYVAMFPLEMETLKQRLAGKLLNRQIPFDDILGFTPGSTVPLYVAEMAVKHRTKFLVDNEPDPNRLNEMDQEKKLGARLIKEMRDFINDFKKQDITISAFYAVGTSRYGIEMCRKIGMHPMDLPTGVRQDRIPFELDMQDIQNIPDSNIIKRILTR